MLGDILCNVPHAGKELDETTITESDCNDNVWLGDTSGLEVDEREDEGCQRESGETERSWVGELALGGWLVKTWLELTTEGWEASRLSGVGVSQWVSAIVVCLVVAVSKCCIWVGIGVVTVRLVVDDTVMSASGVVVGVVLLVAKWQVVVCGG